MLACSFSMRVASRLRFPSLAALTVLTAVTTNCELALKLSNLEGGCPPLRGAAQVKVTSGTNSYCIDATEATNAQYTQFLASGFSLAASDTPDGCTAGASNTPTNDWPPAPGRDNFPVNNISWCQATAYCKWAGKRICGSIGGGALATVNYKDPTLSQWLAACTREGAQTFPYGNTYQAGTCADSTVSLVETHAGCVGGVPGVYDMSGNLWEWTDTCASSDPQAFCSVMGGAFDSTPTELTCVSQRNWTRTSTAANIGVRCCYDL